MAGSGDGAADSNNNAAAAADEGPAADAAPPKPSARARFLTGCHSFGTFMYNPKDHTVMGRTARSWAAIIAFYIAFYAFLAGFWAANLAAFMHTIDFTQPTQQHKFSMLKDNPGMTFEPMTASDSTLIWFNKSSSSSYQAHVDRLASITEPYLNTMTSYYNGDGNVSNVHECDVTGDVTDLNRVCLYDINKMIPSDCRAENDYGFRNGTPCVFLRPNKIFAYLPEPYDFSQNLSATLNNPPSSLFSGPSQLTTNSIGITCEGETPADIDNLLKVEFFPPEGFPFYFYPFLSQTNYLPPFVMARFTVIPGRAVMIWCRIWAKGMKFDRVDLQGSVHIELMVD